MLSNTRLSQTKTLLFAVIFCLVGLGTYSSTGGDNCKHCGSGTGCLFGGTVQCGWSGCAWNVEEQDCKVWGSYGKCGESENDYAPNPIEN